MKLIIFLTSIAVWCGPTESAPSSTGSTSSGCLTPNKDLGSCIPVNKCTSAMNIIKELPIQSGAINKLTPQQDKQLQFLRNSRCKGEHEYSVCCAYQNDPECGYFPEDRIYNGNISMIDGFPWLAIVGYNSSSNHPQELVCGGSLISNKHVLTAASCLRDGKPATIRLGEYDITKNQDCVEQSQGDLDCADPAVNIPVSKVSLHPQYDAAKGEHDLALLTLENDVKYTDFIKPVCLPGSDAELTDKVLDGAGWNLGRSNLGQGMTIKHDGIMSQVSLDDCRQTFGAQDLTEDKICAKGRPYYGSNTVDYGGPLSVKGNQGRHEIIGVAGSMQKDLKEGGDIVVFEKVGSNIDWIRNNMLQ